MASTDETHATSESHETPPEPDESPRARSRVRRIFSGSRDLVRIVYRDPEHVAERLTLFTTGRHGEESRLWAETARAARPDTSVAVIAEEVRTHSAQIARIDGAISGTPFFLALI
ncbi:MAG TPA: hypothetical protein VGH24_05465, partial [Solirubrobacteraceae bacterium]